MSTPYSIAIAWDRVGQPEFDRIVEALIHRQYGAQAKVVANDGRGGDGGRDIIVTDGDRCTIYQLKYFPDGFPTSNRARRRQIRNSFSTAMQHRPNRWILVVPANLTPGEREFVEGLTDLEHCLDDGPEILDRAGLDDLCAQMSDIAAFFGRNQLERILELTRSESAAMTVPMQHLPARISGLAELADNATGLHWGLDFFRLGDRVGVTLRGKHPRAHEVAPITLSATVDRSQLNAETWTTLGYGLDKEARLPVLRLRINDPDAIHFDHDGGELVLGPRESMLEPGLSFEFRFPDGASHYSSVTFAGHGPTGYSIKSEIGRAAKFVLLLPKNPTEHGRFEMTVSLAGVRPSEVVGLCQLRLALADSNEVQFFLDGKRLATARWDAQLGEAERADLQYQLDLAEDLDVIQRHVRQYFPIPETLTGADRAMYRAARLLIDGYRTTIPFYRELTGTLSGTDEPSLRSWLESGESAIRAEVESIELRIAHRTFRFGPLVMFHPSVEIVNADAALDRLNAGTAAGYQILMRPTKGQDFTGYITDGHTSHDVQQLAPWNISGIRERGSGDGS